MQKKSQKPSRQYGGIDAVQRQKERREKFIAAGLEAFGTTGYAKSTIKGICETAGLTERYFYESFQNKEDLLVAVYRRLISELENDARRIMGTPGIAPRDMGYQVLKMFYQHFFNDPGRARVQLFEVLGVSPRVDQEYQSAMRTLSGWITRIGAIMFPEIEEKRLSKSIIPTGAAGAIIEIANQWALGGFKTPIDHIVTQCIDIMFMIGDHFNGSSS